MLCMGVASNSGFANFADSQNKLKYKFHGSLYVFDKFCASIFSCADNIKKLKTDESLDKKPLVITG